MSNEARKRESSPISLLVFAAAVMAMVGWGIFSGLQDRSRLASEKSQLDSEIDQFVESSRP